jgi:hypothetical protein
VYPGINIKTLNKYFSRMQYLFPYLHSDFFSKHDWKPNLIYIYICIALNTNNIHILNLLLQLTKFKTTLTLDFLQYINVFKTSTISMFEPLLDLQYKYKYNNTNLLRPIDYHRSRFYLLSNIPTWPPNTSLYKSNTYLDFSNIIRTFCLSDYVDKSKYLTKNIISEWILYSKYDENILDLFMTILPSQSHLSHSLTIPNCLNNDRLDIVWYLIKKGYLSVYPIDIIWLINHNNLSLLNLIDTDPILHDCIAEAKDSFKLFPRCNLSNETLLFLSSHNFTYKISKKRILI